MLIDFKIFRNQIDRRQAFRMDITSSVTDTVLAAPSTRYNALFAFRAFVSGYFHARNWWFACQTYCKLRCTRWKHSRSRPSDSRAMEHRAVALLYLDTHGWKNGCARRRHATTGTGGIVRDCLGVSLRIVCERVVVGCSCVVWVCVSCSNMYCNGFSRMHCTMRFTNLIRWEVSASIKSPHRAQNFDDPTEP